MKTKLVHTVLTATLVASLVFITIQKSSSGDYDPWIDGNDDGEIDIFDAINLAGAFGTSGNPTKNVTITNWPQTVTQETTVWYANSSFPLTSANYSGSGFSYLHIFLFALYAGPGSSVEFRIYGWFRDVDSSQMRAGKAYITTMTEDPRRDFLSVTIPVPSETFYFQVHLLSGGADVFLSYYLTQA